MATHTVLVKVPDAWTPEQTGVYLRRALSVAEVDAIKVLEVHGENMLADRQR